MKFGVPFVLGDSAICLIDLNQRVMRSFIEEYLANPSQAVASAAQKVSGTDRFDAIDDEMIYKELATGEFRLYEEIIFSASADDLHRADFSRTVA